MVRCDQVFNVDLSLFHSRNEKVNGGVMVDCCFRFCRVWVGRLAFQRSNHYMKKMSEMKLHLKFDT